MKRNFPLIGMIILSLIVLINCSNKGVIPLTLSVIALFGFLFLFYFFNSKIIDHLVGKIMKNPLSDAISGLMQLYLFFVTIDSLVQVSKYNITKKIILSFIACIWFLGFLFFVYSMFKELKSKNDNTKFMKYFIGFVIGLITYKIFNYYI